MSKYVMALIAGMAAMSAVPAFASAVIVTYSGKVTSGFDSTGVFGLANADLGNASFVASFLFDSDISPLVQSATENTVAGGAVYGSSPGRATPGLGASLTINGVTQSIDGSSYSYFSASNNGSSSGQSSYEEEADAYGTDKYLNLAVGTFGLTGLPTALAGPYDGPIVGPPANVSRSGSFQIRTGAGAGNQQTSGYLLPDHLTIASAEAAAAVPEAGTWAMMMVGFGIVGGALRSRRKVSVSFI